MLTSKALFLTSAEGNSFAVLMWAVVFGAFTLSEPRTAILVASWVHFFWDAQVASSFSCRLPKNELWLHIASFKYESSVLPVYQTSRLQPYWNTYAAISNSLEMDMKHHYILINSPIFKNERSWGSTAGIATGYDLDGHGSNPGRGKIFIFNTASRQALGPTQPSIQWVVGAVSPGIKWLGCEADHSQLMLRSIIRGSLRPFYLTIQWYNNVSAVPWGHF
jgi:hypothetical protein